jgi:rhodanese-related sulfurtransferase
MNHAIPMLLAAALLAPAGAASSEKPAAQEDTMTSVPPGVVDGATARRLVEAGAVLVDVRRPDEFAAGHAPGAKNIPHDQIRARAGEIGPPGTPVVVYCASGRRSGLAAQELRALGYEKLWDLQRYDAWPKGQ